MQLLATTGKHDILFAKLNQFITITNAMRTGGTGRADRVIDTQNLERCGEAGGIGARHGARHHVRANPPQAFLTQGVDGQGDIFCGSATGSGDQAGADIGYHVFRKAGILNGLLHGDVIKGSAVAHKTV